MCDDVIVRRSDVLDGRPYIDETQVKVSDVINAIESGFDPDEIPERVFTDLTLEQVEVAIEWATKENRLQAIREKDLIAHEREMRKSRPPISTLIDSRDFISLETEDDVRTTFQPEGHFVRIYYDRKCDTHTLYCVHLGWETTIPIHDSTDTPLDLGDAISLALDFADSRDLLVADEVYRTRSASLGEIFGRE